ncbi:MAG: flagellin lysine-N-methylase [Clostridia bacterium]|nr:flagellin lysine-N-methylase [Clostridia bacterium]
MIMKMPSYCKNFRCIASKCKDNCCIGWEISIDPSSAEYYKSVSGEFGKALERNISCGDEPSFILQGERCPFLNKENLCDIIITLGEDKLCQICRDHPRYFEWFADIKEGGIGLSCEEAARIILGNKETFSTYETDCDDAGCDDYEDSLYEMLTFARDEIISTLENSSPPLKERIGAVVNYAFEVQSLIDNYQFDKTPVKAQYPAEKTAPDIRSFLESFSNLEPIDNNWQKYLQNIIDSSESLNEISIDNNKVDLYLKNIAVYFIWRYFLKGVYDEEIISKVMLMAISVAMIKLMYKKALLSGEALALENCSLLAKNYSKETEYSEENLEKIYNMVYDNPAFRKENILSII